MFIRCFSSKVNYANRQVFLKSLPYYNIPAVKTKTVKEAVNNILYNTPLIKQENTRRILSCLVTNEPGVLSRISGILAGRNFNIDSLVVAKTDVKDLSRMTIVLNAPENVVEQARRQLEDLVPVWAVLDYSDKFIIEREVLLIKVSILPEDRPTATYPDSKSSSNNPNCRYVNDKEHVFGPDFQRQAITELTKLFDGKVLDLTVESMVIELVAKPSRVDAFIKLCRPYGVLEVVRSGMMAIPRTPVEGFEEEEEFVQEEEYKVDATMLPPG